VSGTPCVPDNRFCSPNNMNCASAPTSSAGAMYEFRFTTAGVFPYYCAPHVGAGMVGTITVR
jgi:plastocyanin